MRVIYHEAIKHEDGKCMLKPADILAKIPYKLEFNADELEPMLRALQLDGYFDFSEVEKKGVGMYFFELQKKGYAFIREIMHEKRSIKFKVYLGLLGLSFTVIGIILGRIF